MSVVLILALLLNKDGHVQAGVGVDGGLDNKEEFVLNYVHKKDLNSQFVTHLWHQHVHHVIVSQLPVSVDRIHQGDVSGEHGGRDDRCQGRAWKKN